MTRRNERESIFSYTSIFPLDNLYGRLNSPFDCLVSSHTKTLWFLDILCLGLILGKGPKQYTPGGVPKWLINACHIVMFITNNLSCYACFYPFRYFFGWSFVDYYAYQSTTIVSLVFNIYWCSTFIITMHICVVDLILLSHSQKGVVGLFVLFSSLSSGLLCLSKYHHNFSWPSMFIDVVLPI